MAAKKDGKLGGADFRDGSGNADNAGTSGDTNSDAGNDNGTSADDLATGNNGSERISEPETIGGIRTADPAEFGNDGTAPYGRKADGTPRKPPGRKPGSGTGTRPSGARNASAAKTAGYQSVDGLQKLLFSMHMMGAQFFKTPELSIAGDEAKMLASAIADVQAHYSFEVSPEVTLWSNVAIAAAAVYGPRIVLIMNRKQKEKLERRPKATVTPIVKEGATGFDIPGMHDPVM